MDQTKQKNNFYQNIVNKRNIEYSLLNHHGGKRKG